MGSLFQLRDFWSTSLTGETSPSAFVVANFDNEEGSGDKIAVGTLEGHLQLLKPVSKQNDVADILYEHQFGEPILQICCGDFEVITESITQKLLAILFPRRILLARVQRFEEEVQFPKSEGDAEMETMAFSVYNFDTYFEAPLAHSAYNMVVGRFGKASHDLLCIQALDGFLTIVDHNKVLLSGFIPPDQFLLPGHLAYAADRDVLITNNSSMFIMCYTFPSIVNAFQADQREATFARGITSSDGPSSAPFHTGTQGLSLQPTWAFNLGEDAVGIEVCRCGRNGKENTIVVLCPYSLYMLTTSGACFSSRRLDVESIALSSYHVPHLDHYNLLVSTAAGNINVVSETSLLWSAKIPNGCANGIGVGCFCGVEGMIVSLGDERTVSVNYLGTDPSEVPVQLLESRVQHYSEMVGELATLHSAIKELENEGKNKELARSRRASGGLEAGRQQRGKVEPDSFLQVDVRLSEVMCESKSNAMEAYLSLSLSSSSPGETASDVQIQIETTDPIVPQPSTLTCTDVEKGSPPVVLTARLFPQEDRDGIIPSSLKMIVVVSATIRGQRVFTRRESHLGLGLVAAPAPAVKSMAFSVQLNTEKTAPPSLLDLFKDLTLFGKFSANVLCLLYMNGAKAMILVSKNAARFKVQATHMEGIWLILSELMDRLKRYYADRGEGVTLDIPDPLPLQAYTGVINIHQSVRKDLEAAELALDKAATFFRLVQKRMLSRFRDKNPSSTEALEVLFRESGYMMQSATDATVAGKSRLRQATAMLNASSQFLFTVMSIKYASTLSSRDAAVLGSLFQCRISDDSEETWEENVYRVLYQLLSRVSSTSDAGSVKVSLSESYSLGRLEESLSWLASYIASGKPLLVD